MKHRIKLDTTLNQQDLISEDEPDTVYLTDTPNSDGITGVISIVVKPDEVLYM
jgi:hypothetical protein